MRAFLIVLFSTILIAMIAVTAWASLDRSVLDAGNLFEDPWFVATFCDAYFGFITFYVWVFYKERSTFARLAWFVAIMTLGNMAMATYVLLQLAKWQANDTMQSLLLRSSATTFPGNNA